MTSPTDAAAPVPEPGAALERTRLAWRRTALAALAVPLLGGARLVTPHLVALLLVWLMVLAWFALLGIANRRVAGLQAGDRAPRRGAFAGVALLVMGLAAVGVLLIITS